MLSYCYIVKGRYTSMAHFYPADILLPDFNKIDGTKWATVACDQFTGEPDYWHEAEQMVGDAPSTLKLMIPEAFLGESKERIPLVNSTMKDYLDNVLVEHKDSMIYLERIQSDGRVRRGIIGMIDLEDYDYNKGSTSLIRATEGTVLSRIPPRVEVRRGACVEMPHIMMLINDKNETVFGNLSIVTADAYDFSLMLGGGSVRARFLTKAEIGSVSSAFDKLVEVQDAEAPLLFAIGDGNHSLATAKAMYEEIKSKLGDKAKQHPARYALAEVVNLYDTALDFEPIYRVVFGCEPERLIAALEDYALRLSTMAENTHIKNDPQTVTCVYGKRQKNVVLASPIKNITVATVQDFLDEYCAAHPECEVDYIHDESSLRALAQKEKAVGFIYEGINKNGFFETIIKDGTFPRKTFSMGHARDKRYYIECRRITD